MGDTDKKKKKKTDGMQSLNVVLTVQLQNHLQNHVKWKPAFSITQLASCNLIYFVILA